MKTIQKSIGRDAAIAMGNSQWWVGREPKDVAKIGLITRELCLPFEVLHESLEKALGRPVFTHEMALNFDAIWQELNGERDAPTLQEILDLVPVEKRVVIKI